MGALEPQQLLISIAGVSAIVGLVGWLLGRESTRWPSAEAVREVLAAEEPQFTADQIFVDQAGRAAVALAASPSTELALVFALGRRPVVWRLPGSQLRAQTAPGEVRLATGDFTRPALRLSLPKRDAAALLAALGPHP